MDITKDFGDKGFKAYIEETFCGGRKEIRKADVDQVTVLEIDRRKFGGLQGLEHFRSLEVLNCAYNDLRELDISSHPELRVLDCSGNKLTRLDTSRNPLLEELYVNQNELLSLDLTDNPLLKKLDCGFNRLRRLDLSGNAGLVRLDGCWNLLSELQLENNPLLQSLNCSYNSLFELNLEQQPALVFLDCGHNQLISLQLSGCPGLEELRCNHNHLTRLDLSPHPRLTSLRCFTNHLSRLDLETLSELTELYCSQNKLTVLETAHLSKLERLDAADNLMIEPDYAIEGVGTFAYDNSLSNYTASLSRGGKELSVTAVAADEATMERLAPWITEAWAQLEELHARALELIADRHPDEDVNELTFAELVFELDPLCRLSFDAGETPAGQLAIVVSFDAQLDIVPDLGYETY